ncbi:MAG: class I SAM-dependent methyltransferase [Pseudomonadota bacterium]
MPDTLKERIARHIKMSGPLPLAEYMHWCMADRKDGYYQSRQTIGRDGDFTTAPEISQMFGELIGIWAIKTWEQLGSPESFNLVELGPGRGTLMKDLLRACQVSQSFFNAANVILVETSSLLKETQAQTLSQHENIRWHSSISEIPEAPTILVANEFLDVLPFRQYIKAKDKWHENCVGLDEADELSWVLGTGILDEKSLPGGHTTEPHGSVFEVSVIREAFVENVASLVAENSGAALFIDYGHAKSGFGDTFQAIRGHEYIDTLAEPGLCDLTSHVDFEALKKVALDKGLKTQTLMTQGEFLLSLGLLERAGNLGSGKDPATQERLKNEAERLALPDQMGDLFKVFAFSSMPELWPFSKEA